MNVVVSLISSSHDKTKSINSETTDLFRDMQVKFNFGARFF